MAPFETCQTSQKLFISGVVLSTLFDVGFSYNCEAKFAKRVIVHQSIGNVSCQIKGVAVYGCSVEEKSVKYFYLQKSGTGTEYGSRDYTATKEPVTKVLLYYASQNCAYI